MPRTPAPLTVDPFSWFRTLQVGDVIAERRGVWRIVRAISRKANGDLYAVYLVIRRCSWTHRCYTVLNANDLRTRGFKRIRVKRRPLRTRLDRTIQRIVDGPLVERRKQALDCCDVKGIA
jgi:hypothetical protein